MQLKMIAKNDRTIFQTAVGVLIGNKNGIYLFYEQSQALHSLICFPA
jgi:hypothetical protein